MYNESGFGRSSAPYEYVVTPKMTPALRMKKVLFIMIYVVWGGGLLLVGSTVGKLFLPLLAFIPVTLWMLVFFTWKYTNVAYEYSFGGGNLTVNRLFGEKTRKKIIEVQIRDLTHVYSYDTDCQKKIKDFDADTEIMAASSMDAERLIAIFWTNEDNKKFVLYFEADEKAMRILKYYNSSVR